MKRRGPNGLVLAAAVVFVALVAQVAIAGNSGRPQADAAKGGSPKQIKKLKQQLGAVEARLAALEGKPAGGPPSGGAGGDLAGTYPNPVIAPNAVGPADLDLLSFAEVTTDESTTSAGPTDLATPGPTVTVNVPANGLVALRAQADLKSGTGGQGCFVWIFRDDVLLSDILGHDGTGFLTMHTLPSTGLGLLGTTNQFLSSVIVFSDSPGAHSYELKYSSGVGNTCNFRNRKLWVTALG